jgi:hypothetical protein
LLDGYEATSAIAVALNGKFSMAYSLHKRLQEFQFHPSSRRLRVSTSSNISNRAQGSETGSPTMRREAADHSEGVVARTIEYQTAKLPSDVFLWAAMGCAGLSLMLHMSKDQTNSRFFGQWVAPLLIMGLYNKVVKVAGSDQWSQMQRR